MQLLASCSLEKSREFNGNLVLPNEDKKTPDRVLLNVVVDDGDVEVFKQLSGKEKCITFVGKGVDFCPTNLKGKVFNEISLEKIKSEGVEEVKDVTTLVRVPNGYSDMREIYELSCKYPFVRFIGGYLLGIEGVKVGRYEEGKDRMPPIFKDMYDSFVEVDLEDLDGLQEIVKKTRKKAESLSGEPKKKKGKGGKSSAKKEKKTPKRVESFNRLFVSGGEEF